MKTFKGASISQGIAIAPPFFVQGLKLRSEERAIESTEVEREFQRFLDAVSSTRQELSGLREKTSEEIGESEAEIFDAHILVLEDPLLHLEVSKKLEAEKKNIETVLANVIGELTHRFSQIDDEVMKERSSDIADVGQLLIRHLTGRSAAVLRIEEPCILVASEIPPSTAAKLDSEMVLGCVIEVGSSTSHTAIIARALGIPAVVVSPGSISELQEASRLVVDGLSGVVVADPDDGTVAIYEERDRQMVERELMLRRRTSLEAITTDGVLVNVAANLEIPGEIMVAREHGAQGVGLYRTEFLFLNRRQLPNEDEQYHHYRVVAEAFPNQDVVIRTIDIGGDKFLSSAGMPEEVNPFLGMRAIRFSLKRPEFFRTQLRAIIRASRHGRVRILFPMIACIEEVSAALGFYAECCAELGVGTDTLDVGIMIETPAAALNARVLGSYMDFFSIGTNDLIQYTMAAERGNEQLEYLHRPMQPTIVRLIAEITRAAQEAEIDISVCGEMAGDLAMIPVLLGCGVTKLSMNPRVIPVAKELVRRVSTAESRELVVEISGCLFTSDAAEVIERRIGDRIRDLKSDSQAQGG